jgi:DnaJ-domain-containing protein 1
MGQLFDRLKNFVKVSASDFSGNLDSAERMLDTDDDELRRIIDELNSDASSASGRTGRSSSQQGGRAASSPNIPPEVVTASRVLGVAPSAHISEIRSAWRRKIAAVHPDRMHNRPQAEQMRAQREAQAINAAWATLQRYHEQR